MKTPPTRKTPPKPRVVDLREAAELLHVDPMTLFKMVRRGEVPGALKIGLAWRIDLAELERFLEDRPRRYSKSFSSLNPVAEVRPNEMVSGDSSQFIDVVVFDCDLGVGGNALVGPCDHCETTAPIVAFVLFADDPELLAGICVECYGELVRRKIGDVV
jgi:excisionase family DNA binding protein